jgi:glycosyltransferase involved in cell wall biosynthesis
MISVAMTSFNGGTCLKSQIESILPQLSESDELIISDNGSTDGSVLYLKTLAENDARVRFFAFSEKQGVVPNMNHVLLQVRGSIVFLSDHDDIWLDRRIAHCRAMFDSDPTLLLLQTNAEIIDELDNRSGKTFFEIRKCGPGLWKNFFKNTYQGCNMAFRTELLQTALPIPERISMHDVWIGIIAECVGNVRFDSTVLVLYRRHAGNQSGMSPSSPARVMGWRLNLVFNLLKRRKAIRAYKKGRTRSVI